MTKIVDALDRIEMDDDEFADGVMNGHLAYYDQTPPRPVSSCTALYDFMCKDEYDHSPRWWTGYLAGWFIGFGENNPAFFWQSDPPPAHLHS